MDKYEYKLKLDQIKTLAAEGNYHTAAELADSINWRKVKNVNLLIKAGDIYSKTGRYDEAKEILLMAYDRSPIGRMIIYRLAELAVKMQNFDEAEEYYDEFVEIAPHDNLKYILRYKISKAKGADFQTQINILEELKDVEYTEEWAYELAYLYHQSGQSAKCIEACDELILWFGDGIYVERALELKMLYQPLTKSQEEKYRSFKQRKEDVKEVYPDEGRTQITIPAVEENTDRYNTLNLQEELAKSMQQIMEATETETVTDTLDNIKRMTEEIPYLQIPYEDKEEEIQQEVTEEEIDAHLRINFKEMLSEDNDGQISMLVTDRYKEPQINGQMSIQDVLNEWERTKRAAETAMEMAKQQRLETAKARALQEAGDIMERLSDVIPKLDAGMKPSDLLKEEYLGELQRAAVQGVGLAESGAEDMLSEEERAGRIVAGMNQILQRQIDRLQAEEQQEQQAQKEQQQEEEREPQSPQELQRFIRQEFRGQQDSSKQQDEKETSEHELLRMIKEAKPSFDEQIGLRPYVPDRFDAGQVMPEEVSQEPEDEIPVTEEIPVLEEPSEEESIEMPQDEPQYAQEPEDFAQEADDVTILARQMIEAEKKEEMAEAFEEEPEFTEEELEQAAKEFAAGPLKGDTTPIPPVTTELPKITIPEDITADIVKQDTKDIKAEEIAKAMGDAAQKAESSKEKVKTGEYPPITKLNEEQKSLFSYFVPVDGMEQQICKALTGACEKLSGTPNPGSGNILIQGGPGSGKTVLATALVKALQREVKRPNGKIGKIDAEALNRKDIPDLLKKIAGGCLIIEKAGDLNRETAVKLSLLLENDTSGLLVIMEDSRKGLNQALARDDGLAKKFTEKITIPVFTSDELVAFGKAYANDLDYDIDAMGVLALYNRISNIQRLDHATTLTEVKDIIDKAIERAEKKSLKKAFSIITSRRYNEDDYVILREKDFEE